MFRFFVARTGVSPSSPGLSRPFPFLEASIFAVLLPRSCRNSTGLGSVRFDRHYSGHRCFFLFLQVLRCFSSLRLPRLATVSALQTDGFPHSDISGSIPVCCSPELFAAYHVLLRLQKPRHPPSALFAFVISRSAYPDFSSPVRNASGLSFFYLFRPLLLLPRYLFPVLSMNLVLFRFFSNGLQRYGLFNHLQIFLGNFFEYFLYRKYIALYIKRMHRTIFH